MVQKMNSDIHGFQDTNDYEKEKILLVVRHWDESLSLESISAVDSVPSIQDALASSLELGVGLWFDSIFIWMIQFLFKRHKNR